MLTRVVIRLDENVSMWLCPTLIINTRQSCYPVRGTLHLIYEGYPSYSVYEMNCYFEECRDEELTFDPFVLTVLRLSERTIHCWRKCRVGDVILAAVRGRPRYLKWLLKLFDFAMRTHPREISNWSWLEGLDVLIDVIEAILYPFHRLIAYTVTAPLWLIIKLFYRRLSCGNTS